MTNPLLVQHHLPPFSKIKAADIEPAVDEYLKRGRELLTKLLPSPACGRGAGGEGYTWNNLIAPLEEEDDQLNQAWSPVSHLHAVKNTSELRKAYQVCIAKLSNYQTEVGQNHQLFLAYQAIHDREDFKTLSQAQQKSITDALQHFKLAGVALEKVKQARYKAIQQRLATLTTQYENHVMDATDHWFCHIEDKARLSGLPVHTLHAAQAKAQSKQLSGWCLGVDAPCYLAVMTYADDRELRQTLYTAFVTRASDQGPDANRYDNTPIMDEILALRHELAQLLGFDNFAALSIEPKMAESTEQVVDFLMDLVGKAKPAARKEIETLQQFATEKGFQGQLQAWDIAYFSEKLSQERYGLSQETLRPYFPVEQVMQGLFELIQRIYGMRVSARVVDTWDPAVKFYDIHDRQGEWRGSLYVDLYARPQKRGGAWMDECRVRRRMARGGLQAPVAYLTCNFAAPIDNQPACITHDDVVTLFHEFGHCLHHLMTRVEVAAVSGINGVEWDAVELPSQFMENFCWQREVIDLISKHVDTGAKLPDDLLSALQRSRTFQSAIALLRQVEFALFDFLLHRDYLLENDSFPSSLPTECSNPENNYIRKTLNQVRQDVAVLIPPEFNRFQNSFTHVFSGGYAAGYYSYKWAEVLSADAFSRFEDEGILNAKTGHDFLTCILEKGGSDKAINLFKKFRGRTPQIEALLRQTGITSDRQPTQESQK